MDEVTAFLSRLTGEPLSADQPIRLRSVQRAALGSWARKNGVAIQSALIKSDTPFSVRELLGVSIGEAKDAIAPAVVSPPSSHGAAPSGTIDAVGIDIEDVDSLPQTSDYREHPFFRDHFTASEIAYCIRQPDAAASFCGTWAAKEAMLKAGLFDGTVETLNAIEIGRDGNGRPVHPACTLSISHAKRAAVAVCLARGPHAMAGAAPQSRDLPVQPESGPPATSSARRRKLGGVPLALVGVAVVCVAACAAWGLALWA